MYPPSSLRQPPTRCDVFFLSTQGAFLRLPRTDCSVGGRSPLTRMHDLNELTFSLTLKAHRRQSSMYTPDIPQTVTEAQPPVRKLSGRRRHKHKPGNEGLCKYASKACYNPRVVKKTGDLHRYCEHHRLQANRNQRRLEQRRRVKGRGDTSSGGDDASVSAVSYSSDNSSSESADEWKRSTAIHQNLPVMIFEPFQHPVSLEAEDLYSLRSIFDDPQQHEEAKSSVSDYSYQL